MRSEEKDDAYDSLHPGRAPEAHYAKINSARHSRFPECVYFGGEQLLLKHHSSWLWFIRSWGTISITLLRRIRGKTLVACIRGTHDGALHCACSHHITMKWAFFFSFFLLEGDWVWWYAWNKWLNRPCWVTRNDRPVVNIQHVTLSI